MSQSKLADARKLIKQVEMHEKAITDIKRMAELLAAGEAKGMRLKCNAPDGSQRVVMAVDLGPAFFEAIGVDLQHALAFHEEQLAELTEETDEATAAGTPTPVDTPFDLKDL